MIGGATAQRVGLAVGKVLLRHAVSELGGKYVEVGVDLAMEVAEALAEEEGRKARGSEPPPPAPNDIVAVMRGMTPAEVGRSIDAALASADLQPLAISITPKGKEELKQRAVREMSAFDRLYREMDAEEARQAAERLEKKRQEIERKRQEKEAERLRRQAEIAEKLAPLKAQLLESLTKRDYRRARVHADAILAMAPNDHDALEADKRLDAKLKDRFKRAFANFGANLQPLVALVMLSKVAGCWQMRDWNAPLGSGPVYREDFPWPLILFLLGFTFLYSFVGTYVGWPMFRWWHLRKRD